MSYTNFHKLFTYIYSNHIIFPLIQTTSSLLANQLKSTQIHSSKSTPQSKHNIKEIMSTSPSNPSCVFFSLLPPSNNSFQRKTKPIKLIYKLYI